MFDYITKADVGVLEVYMYARMNPYVDNELNFLVGKRLKLLVVNFTTLVIGRILYCKIIKNILFQNKFTISHANLQSCRGRRQ